MTPAILQLPATPVASSGPARRLAAFAVGLLLLVSSLGCRRDPFFEGRIELLNQEKRTLEDELYDLAWDYELQQKKLQRLAAENAALRRQNVTGPGIPENPSGSSKTPRGAGAALGPAPAGDSGETPPEITPPDLSPPEIGDPPEIDVPPISPPAEEGAVPPTPAGELPPRRTVPAVPDSPEIPDLSPPAIEMGQPADQRFGNRTRPGAPVAQAAYQQDQPPAPTGWNAPVGIRIHPRRSGGTQLDSSPGDDGLQVWLEPHDAAGNFVPLAGRVAVVLMDPAYRDERAYVARWDLSERQTQARMRAGGIALKLAWQAQLPAHRRLHVFVRYELADGRRWEDDLGVYVTLPAQSAAELPQRAAREPSPGQTGESSPGQGAIPAADVPAWKPQRN